MQINGIGSSHSDMHHVTDCIHSTQKHLDGKVGGASAGAANSNMTQTIPVASDQTGEPFSLSSWLQNALSGARRLFGRIWGSNADTLSGETVAEAGTTVLADMQTQEAATLQESVMRQEQALDISNGLQSTMQHDADSNSAQEQKSVHILHASQVEAASAVVQPSQNYNNNPYFTTVTEAVTTKQNVWQKLKVQFHNLTGFLTKRFSFGNSSSFHTGQERSKEDLRRHSRYREDDMEIDCILTDDSYLLDSYNEKGEYSKL